MRKRKSVPKHTDERLPDVVVEDPSITDDSALGTEVYCWDPELQDYFLVKRTLNPKRQVKDKGND